MLDYLVYYPISIILWFWHKAFVFIGELIPGVDSLESNGLVWVLSVVFLVCTLRGLLYAPMARQIRFGRKMQELQPKMKAIQARYKHDRVRLAEEQRKLQKEESFNPLLGCLPMLVQIPVFIGLFHVLRSFNRMGNQFGQLDMTAEETRAYGNYFFSAEEVRSFLDARIFGAPLSSFVTQPVEQFAAFLPDVSAVVDFSRENIAFIAIPLMIISAVTTHFNAKATISRQSPEAASTQQAQIMNWMTLWAFPVGILATGVFWPIAILVYMVANNLWTYGQTNLVYRSIYKEEEAAKEVKKERQAALAPKPGAKPTTSVSEASSTDSSDTVTIQPVQRTKSNASRKKRKGKSKKR